MLQNLQLVIEQDSPQERAEYGPLWSPIWTSLKVAVTLENTVLLSTGAFATAQLMSTSNVLKELQHFFVKFQKLTFNPLFPIVKTLFTPRHPLPLSPALFI